jgi:hypothetical protein
MRSTRTTTAVAALATAALVASAAPAAAVDIPGLPGLFGTPTTPTTTEPTQPPDGQPPPPAEQPTWGSVAGQSAPYAKGCTPYSFTYAVTPPSGVWALEVFVTGPDGLGAAHAVFVQGADPLSGTGSFQLCRGTTPGGTFTLTAKVSVENRPADPGPDGVFEGMLPPSTFVVEQPPAPPKVKTKAHHKKHKAKQKNKAKKKKQKKGQRPRSRR